MDGFGHVRAPVVVFHETSFVGLRHEGAVLFALHWLEASADRSIPLDLDWERYALLEEAGMLLTVAARSGGVLIGYVIYLIYPQLHYRGLVVADSDAFFLRPSDRRGATGIRLFQVAEALLRERGVHEVWGRVKLHVRPGRGRSDLGPLFSWLGYRPVETLYRKRIG